MALGVRPLSHEDYDLFLSKWWNDWGWTPPSREFLPENGMGGVCVFEDTIPICAGFLYATNSKVAWVDWVVSNMEYKKKPERKQAIELLVHTLTNVAKNSGYLYSYALIKHQGLIETYKNLGYIQGDLYTSEMIKAL